MGRVKLNNYLISFGTFLLCVCAFLATTTTAEETVCNVCKCLEPYVHCTGLNKTDLLRSYSKEPVSALMITDSSLEKLAEEDLLKFSNVSELYIQFSNLQDTDNLFRSFTDVISLDLRNNSLTKVKNDTFSTNQELMILDLRNNKIRTIEGNAFSHLTSLAIVTLSGNQIEQIDNDTFAGLNKLLKLDLGGNRLKVLRGASFTGAENLKTLILSGNQLANVEVFNGLEMLSNLDLSNNKFETLEDYCFSELWLLQNLRLSDNRIKSLKTNSLTGLKELKLLDLSSNRISDVDEFAFKDLELLVSLDLSGNLVATLADNTFENLNKLESLNLSGNQLRSLSDVLLQESVTELHLEGNELSAIGTDLAWRLFVPEMKVSLRGNPFVCMCETLGAAYGMCSAFAFSPPSSFDIFCDGDENIPWSDVIPALNCTEIDDYDSMDSSDYDDESDHHSDVDWDFNDPDTKDSEEKKESQDSEESKESQDSEEDNQNSEEDGNIPGVQDPISEDDKDSIGKFSMTDEEAIQLEDNLIQTIESEEVVITKLQRFDFKIHIIVLSACAFTLLSMTVAVVMSFLYRRQTSKNIKSSEVRLLP